MLTVFCLSIYKFETFVVYLYTIWQLWSKKNCKIKKKKFFGTPYWTIGFDVWQRRRVRPTQKEVNKESEDSIMYSFLQILSILNCRCKQCCNLEQSRSVFQTLAASVFSSQSKLTKCNRKRALSFLPSFHRRSNNKQIM